MKRMSDKSDNVNIIILGNEESPIEVYGEEDILVIRGLREAREKFKIPRFLINWAHRFRVKLNPRYADENYDTDIHTSFSLEKIIDILKSWGCKINDPIQFWYKDQVASGHISFLNGRQLHIRVYGLGDGRYSLKAHAEWDGLVRPIQHMMYAGLDYEKGYRILKRLWEHSLRKIKGEGRDGD